MKQKTKLQIIQKIANYLQLQDKYTPLKKIITWASYIIQIVLFQICLLVSIIQPQLHISQTLQKYSEAELSLLIVRIIISLLYILTKSIYLIPLIKILQCMNIYLIRTGITAVPLIFEFIAQIYHSMRKQKRYVNFDSRLENKYYATKIFAVYIMLFATFLTPSQQINKNPSAVFFCAIIYYVAACLDNIYSYRAKQILRNIALCTILMSIYFMCLPLFSSLNTFGLIAHCLITFSILVLLMLYSIMGDYTYHHDILYKKILNLESRDKLLYIWSMIYFSQNPSLNSLICFIKTHQSKCYNSLCPLNFATPSSNSHKYDNSQHHSYESLRKAIKIYLHKALQRFASQSDEIRRLYIYFRQQDDPKIVHLLRQDDVYQKIQEVRISKNLQSYNDVSLQYQQMKQIEAQTLTKVKLYLNHYDYFLAYVNKQSIKMQTTEQIIQELIKLKNYFLSFKPNENYIPIQDQKKSQKSNGITNMLKNKKGYQKIQEEVIPLKKMTLKTTILVNFMRKVYFNLPTLQKQQSVQKKINYISQDIQQSPILVVSAESYNLGKIINWNSMAQKILLYPTKQMKQKFVNDLVPKSMHKVHQKIFMKASLSIQIQEVHKGLSADIFCFTKSLYAQVFELKIQGTNSISGNKWVVQMKHKFQNQAVLILDQKRSIIGLNKNCIGLGITQNQMGQMFNKQLFDSLTSTQHRKQKIAIQKNNEVIQGFEFQQETQWQHICTTPKYQDMPLYHIILVQKTHQIEKMTLSRFTKTKNYKQNNNNQQKLSSFYDDEIFQPTNGFEFKFDPYTLKYTNQTIPAHEESDLELIWQEYIQEQLEQKYNNLQKDGLNSGYNNPLLYSELHGKTKQQKNYSQNIHQMIYFENKLQFKQNYEVVTQFQTHPNYIPNGKMSKQKSQLNNMNLNKKITKDNFIQNIIKIKQKVPVFVYQLIILFFISGIIFMIGLALRFMQFTTLYKLRQEKQLINLETINRKNLIDNIGSLAIWGDKSNITSSYNPVIWQNYIKNKWTYQQLFVQIQYTNNRINTLNSQIGLLVNKQYSIKNTKKSLASYFQLLSIQASTQISGKLNLTMFVLEIVDDIAIIQNSIMTDMQNYYNGQENTIKNNIFIVDTLNILICSLSIIILHFILRKAYIEKVQLFKSLSVVEEQEIYRIQKNLNDHRDQIKNNQLDATCIVEDDYSQPVASQNIPHAKKMIQNYFKSRFIFFYGFFFILLIVSAFFFLISRQYFNNKQKISLISPFVNIVGQQRNSMSKMVLNVMAYTKNSTYISTDIAKNIRMFQINKKGVIDSLIAKQFSEQYIAFYNEIWFSPCEVLGLRSQCSSLFSGILADNLDYNYVYVLTQVEKIVDYRIQRVTPPLSLDPQFQIDVDSQITKSLSRVNFLLFDFMTKLHKSYTTQSTSQINFLFAKVQRLNLLSFLAFLIANIFAMAVLFFLIYYIKNIPNNTLQMITTVVPIHLLMRNQYFVEWYQRKFKNIY